MIWEHVKKLMQELEAMKGAAGSSSGNLKKMLTEQTDFSKTTMKLYAYPHLMKAVESANTEVSERLQQIQYLMAQYSTRLSWLTPELLEVPQDKMMEWIESDEELQQYKFSLQKMYHKQEHVLDESMENLLSYFSQLSDAPSAIYDELANSDIEYKKVELSDGSVVTATPGTSKQVLTYNKNQQDRHNISKAMYEVYSENKHTYAAIYNAVCQSEWASARARKI
ncbi:MAG: hypothetical protein U5L09_05985 [Bacteroidales bacterium]|nr:hypothetical protein [Bacteroidales bacterium]